MLHLKALLLTGLTCNAIALATPALAADHTAKEKVLYSFCAKSDCADGEGPFNLILDAAGNLYGTTLYGGEGNGVAFELSPQADGTWTEKVLHTFCSFNHCSDGAQPSGGLVFDEHGNLYGATGFNCGVVFRLKPRPDGTWSEKVLHKFQMEKDGCGPTGNLALDAKGNVYGTTVNGNPYLYGIAFELSPTSRSPWKENAIYQFDWQTGAGPMGGLAIDSSGNLYGTTSLGGTINCPPQHQACGVVFELSPTKGGGWKETTLHSFNGLDGSYPVSNLIFDSSGNLYGTTVFGGEHSNGTVFELAYSANGKWTEKVLRSFHDYRYVTSGVLLDTAGNLYGTTSSGGYFHSLCGDVGCGTLYELSPDPTGPWTETTLRSFGPAEDGEEPGGLVMDANGNLYGVTFYGGPNGGGVVFEITP